MQTDGMAASPRPDPRHRLLALQDRIISVLEVLLCSSYPTQWVIAGALPALGIAPRTADGQLSIWFVSSLALADTVALIGLICLFLAARGESIRGLLLGSRPIRPEAMSGLRLIPVALVIAMAALGLSQLAAPWLRTVVRNPLRDLADTWFDASIFGLVVIVAGGVREEVQRAFLLDRFERSLGGKAVGVVVTSASFGAGHAVQGLDAAFATGLLGAFWAVTYLRRRSIVAPMISHAGFNILELARAVAGG
jgi:membrane protease YdiL (CAAX protease family)